MDRKRNNSNSEGDAEAVSAQLQKRQRELANHWDNGAHGQRKAPLTHDEYTIAWVCALPLEMATARAMLDEIYEPLPRLAGDNNAYTLGRIGKHNIVMACLPDGQIGTVNAASVMDNMMRSFNSIYAVLMVGIGGGVPTNVDIRLGDVVVGTRVMEYDLGKVVGPGQIQGTAVWKLPHKLLGTAITSLRAKHQHSGTGSQVSAILKERSYSYPNSPDQLFSPTYDHISSTSAGSCDRCDQSKLIHRIRRKTNNPQIHYGGIASGNKLMRSAGERDHIARQLDIMCFEMEAAGVMGTCAPPCLPIRGICDYSDSHKNKTWQAYAAAAAAAYAREFVTELPVLARERLTVAQHLIQGT